MHPQLITAGLTDIGRRRDSNQDNFLVADFTRSLQVAGSSLPLSPGSRVYGTPLSRLILVADGMGGHQAGARASAQAIEAMVRQLLETQDWFDVSDHERMDQFALHIDRLFRSTHRTLETASRNDPSLKGMGTTLTLVYIAWPRMIVVHAGDSRCYLLRNNQLKSLTKDHTIASQLVSRGELKEQDAASSPWGNMLWNVLGGGGMDVRPDICTLNLQADDWILVCTDGLNKHLTDDEILKKLASSSDPHFNANQLIDSANEKGGSDNITVVLTRVAPVPSQMSSDFSKPSTTIREMPGTEPTTDVLSPTTSFETPKT